MRCASCGTENERDSRFCGGCGAKLQHSSVVAPTAKIPDDAAYPPAAATPSGARAQLGPVSHGPASIPPGFNPHAPASIPPPMASYPPHSPQPDVSLGRAPTGPSGVLKTPPPGSLHAPPQRPASQPGIEPPGRRTPAPAASMADSLVTPPQRPIGLIAVILIADLGLAAAGAVMLGKGLSAKHKVEQKAAPASDAPMPEPAKKSELEPPPAAPTPEPAAPPTDVAVAAGTDVAPAAKPAAKVETKPAAEAKSDTHSAKRGKSTHVATGSATSTAGPVTTPSALPEDPYGEFNLAAEAKKLDGKSKSAFDRCVADAAPVHGTINIAYQVLADGRVDHASAVENSTGKDELGRCLVAIISAWRFPSHAGATLDSVRPFNYP